ncbi:MAG: ACT domain-containing protein [Dehalococcoidia bacterium]|nr:ACT domain-containing protein [Dehalococcoidia bacterium]
MAAVKRTLRLLPGTYAVCRLDPATAEPDWAGSGTFYSVTRTAAELSVVCDERLVPEGVVKEGGWKVAQVAGPLDLSMVGVLVSLIGPLAREGISVFVLSTYDTDYLLVKAEQLGRALQVLRVEEHEVA